MVLCVFESLFSVKVKLFMFKNASNDFTAGVLNAAESFNLFQLVSDPMHVCLLFI